ncbi:MAG: hypothetical protein GY832_11690 [Chloroflexi bacterium]|nr:hypothetical protein [Chloroflexota bacterium]
MIDDDTSQTKAQTISRTNSARGNEETNLEPQTPKRKLTERQRLFAKAYAETGSETIGNGKQSAIKAGYSDKDAHAEVQAVRLLGYEQVKVEIARIQAVEAEKSELKRDKILATIAKGLSMAVDKGNLSAMARFLELQAKIAGLTDLSSGVGGSPTINVHLPETQQAQRPTIQLRQESA